MNEVVSNSKYDTKPTNPLLLVLRDEKKFNSADIRIMIYGQETNDWGGNFENNIEETKVIYNDFFNTNACFSYGGQFWNGVNLFLKKIRQKYPEKKVEFLWNNVVKFGKSGEKNTPPKYISDIENENFAILGEEIDIIKPNLLLFLSGPYYDHILKNQIKGFDKKEELSDFTSRQLSKFKYNEEVLCYRTYHPNYLWRNDINKYFDRILDDFKIK
jgi:uracil-DNA glycosylase